jgi:hypothetical protein
MTRAGLLVLCVLTGLGLAALLLGVVVPNELDRVARTPIGSPASDSRSARAHPCRTRAPGRL